MVGKTAVHDDHLGRDVDEGGGDGDGVNGGDDHDDDFEESDHCDVGKAATLVFPSSNLSMIQACKKKWREMSK